MAIGKDKAADHSRSVTAYAVTAVLGCGLLMAPMQSAAQAVNQPATATTPVAVDPNAPVTPTTDTAGTATATATATTPDARTTDADARPNPRLVFDAPDILRTGSILDDDIGRVNMRGSDLNSLRSKARPTDDQQLGIKLGTFTLRPSVNQSYNVETNKGGGTNDHRTYLQSDFENTLTSDWDRHQLTITGNGIWQRNVSGTGEEQPSINLGADLRLDLAEQTTAHLTGGYKFFREDTDDPNALSGATKQSNVNEYDLGASIERDFGLLRGTTAVTLARTVYSDATLADGTLVSLSDRNQTAGTWRGRIGYELSPALIPFRGPGWQGAL